VPEQAAAGAPFGDELHPVAVGHSDVVFAGKVWDIRRDEFVYGPDLIVREYVDHTGAVAVLAMDDQDRVLLIQQYRHPIGVRDWEIPAGLLDIEGEDPLVGAQRELAEEADLEAADWSLLSEIFTTPGGSNEAIRVYLARGLTALPAFARSEEEADIVTRWVDLDEAVDGVLAHRLRNSILGHAVLSAFAARTKGWESLGPADAPWDLHPRNRG
jgi:8-oxo-dGDP phosphatase